MSELTNLTAEEIFRPLEHNGTVPPEHRAEILRRLERLEKCEAALRLCTDAMGKWQDNAWEEYADAIDAARAALEGK